jgi:hypothetical protein
MPVQPFAAAPSVRGQSSEIRSMRSLARILFATTISATALVLTITLSPAALAAASDYRFELVRAQPLTPGATNVTVRLLHVPDQKPIAGAVIFQSRVHMGPAGMDEMTGKATAGTATQPGEYLFRTETDMAGSWALTLSAKVQGEAQTVTGLVNFDVAQ